MVFLHRVPMSSLLISDAPVEHQTGVDACTARDTRNAVEDGLGEADRDEPNHFTWRLLPRISWTARRILIEELVEPLERIWVAAHDDGFDTAMPKENCSLHCPVRAPKPSARFSNSDVLYSKIPLATHWEIALEDTSGLENIRSSLGRYSIDHTDLRPSNILLDSKMVLKISDYGISKVLHAHDYTHVPMGREVPTHNGLPDAKPSKKRCIYVVKLDCQVARRTRYLCVHHHPFIQMLSSARKRSGDIFTSCVRLITSKTIFGVAEAGWIRKHLGTRNGLTVNEPQQHSDPDSCRSDHGKMAVNTKTSASWIVATAAPHHATGNRNLLSGFIMEHDDQFVHAASRVPFKVLARGAVVTDALILPDVWFVPGLTENLVSVSQLAELDHSIRFGRGECCIRSACDAKIVGKGRLQKGGHYVLDYLKVPLAI